MTPRQIELIKESFAKVVPIADQAAAMFYGRLFEIAPDVRPLFKGDIDEQGRKLMATLGLAVSSLDRLSELQPALNEMGRRHAAYGVRDEHYAPVAQALLWTLEQGLGDSFTGEARDAWVSVYTVLAGVMKSSGVAPA